MDENDQIGNAKHIKIEKGKYWFIDDTKHLEYWIDGNIMKWNGTIIDNKGEASYNYREYPSIYTTKNTLEGHYQKYI